LAVFAAVSLLIAAALCFYSLAMQKRGVLI
jgi:hypothetical protein